MPFYSDPSKFVTMICKHGRCLLLQLVYLTVQLPVNVVFVCIVCTDSLTTFIQKLLLVVPEETKVE